MNISFRKGNFIHFLISTIIYISAVILFPVYIVPLFPINQRMNMVIISGIIAAIILLFYGLKVRNSIDKQKSNIFISIGIGILGLLVLVFAQNIINTILQLFHFEAESQNTNNIVNIINKNYLFVVYVAITGPILEELFFRKALFGYLYDIFEDSNKYIRFIIPALITGVVFAIPHDGVSPIMLVYVAMSFVFSYLYVKTKSIISPMTAHILMNSLVVFAQVYLKAKMGM